MHYITFLFHFDLYKRAMIILEETLKLAQKELNIRLNLRIIGNAAEKRKTRRKYLSCVRMMIIILMSLGAAYKRMAKIDKFVELAHTSQQRSRKAIIKSRQFKDLYC